MPFHHFTAEQITPLIIAGCFLLSSVILFRIKRNLSLVLLFVATVGLGYFIANLDPFLILWDEQYHALVAKNLSRDMLKPMLYSDPIVAFDYKNWTENQIWLHKQPLFLWQIALSIKLFGTNALAVRIPSILMHALIPIFIYRIGKIVKSEEAGYYGGLLFAVAYFPLELVAGRYATDHNDVAFLFYVTASFWAWFEYERTHKKYWLLLIGVFSGGAILVKWLAGLLVFCVWLTTKTIVNFKDKLKFRTYLPLLYSGAISVLVFIPWQMYISLVYPKESSYEYRLNTSHFFQPIEGHGESTWFYFTDGLKKLYGSGDIVPVILLSGLLLLLINVSDKKFKIAIASTVIFVYAFYTIAATKMTAFTIITAPFVYLGLGYLIHSVLSLIEKKVSYRIVTYPISLIIPFAFSYVALNLTKIQNYHTAWKPNDNHNRIGELIEMDYIRTIDEHLGNESYVLFNASITHNGHIPIMFYTDHVAYNFIPSEMQIKTVRSKNRKIAVLDLGKLPDYINNDTTIRILKVANKELLDK